MTSPLCLLRLQKELRQLQKSPIENIFAAPKEGNLLEWHYVFYGAKGTCYEGGYYHGLLIFRERYPLKPPSITMMTPNGRFKVSYKVGKL